MNTAIFSPDRVYRYLLIREVNPLTGRGAVAFICLNGSLANEVRDDPTVRRMMDFTRRWEKRYLWVLNAFALVSMDPKRLKQVADPVGPENDAYLCKWGAKANLRVVGWGNHGGIKGRDAVVARMLPKPLYCLGINQGGQPVHPLYVPANRELTLFQEKPR